MPHRNRTLLMVVSLVWILVIVATLVNAAVRTGGEPKEGEERHSAAILAEALVPGVANPRTLIDLVPPA